METTIWQRGVLGVVATRHILQRLGEVKFYSPESLGSTQMHCLTIFREKYLEEVEKEIQRLEEFQFANKDFFEGVWELIKDSKLADDLFAR